MTTKETLQRRIDTRVAVLERMVFRNSVEIHVDDARREFNLLKREFQSEKWFRGLHEDWFENEVKDAMRRLGRTARRSGLSRLLGRKGSKIKVNDFKREFRGIGEKLADRIDMYKEVGRDMEPAA